MPVIFNLVSEMERRGFWREDIHDYHGWSCQPAVLRRKVSPVGTYMSMSFRYKTENSAKGVMEVRQREGQSTL